MSNRFKWRIQYDERADEAAAAHCAIRCEDESLTKQAPAVDADINVLVKRFGIVDGNMPVVPADPSHYGDVAAVADLRSALDVINVAKDAFYSLDPKLRAMFGNDMARLHAFVMDPSNAEQAVALGLLKARQGDSDPVEPVVPPAGGEGGS